MSVLDIARLQLTLVMGRHFDDGDDVYIFCFPSGSFSLASSEILTEILHAIIYLHFFLHIENFFGTIKPVRQVCGIAPR